MLSTLPKICKNRKELLKVIKESPKNSMIIFDEADLLFPYKKKRY